ncbi:hypothetical protein NC652_024890 [Populus alba x Populus x berolinensis]|nr:hypothetical protein NC652_024890 [Populus alba x Populus x berolinensis]
MRERGGYTQGKKTQNREYKSRDMGRKKKAERETGKDTKKPDFVSSVSSQGNRGDKTREKGRHRIDFQHLFTIFNNSLASRNPDRRRTSIDLTSEDAELQNRERRSIRKNRGEQPSIQPTTPNIFITIVDVLSRGNTKGRQRRAVDKSHHQRHHCFRRLQKQQLQSSIFSSHCTEDTRRNKHREEQKRERKNTEEP